MKKIVVGMQSLDKIVSGASKLCDAVKLTLGPKGKNVAIDRKYTYPIITNDGVTIAKEIVLDDEFENVGASSIKQASIKSNDVAGDGTTTATILATSILTSGAKQISRGANAVMLKKGITKACQVITSDLSKLAKAVESKEDIFNIASISAGNTEIGSIITQAFEIVGKDGVITVEDGKTCKTELKITQGLEFDRGYISPYMITDTQKMVANLSNPLILVTDEKITNINQIIHVLEAVNSSGTPLLIIAEDYDTEVINTLVVNKLRGNLNVVCVKCPAFADKKQALLMDICTIANASIISQSVGKTLATCTMDDLGRASNVVVSKDSTIISGGKGNEEKIIDRANAIKEQIELANSDFDKENLKTRLAKLTTGIAVIQVGSNTELEMQELKLRIEDAIEATKSATEEGIVPGGGIAYLCTLDSLDTLINSLTDDEKLGAQIVKQAILEPIKIIAQNAGVSGDVVLEKVLSLHTTNKEMGYDALNDTYVNMFDAGIIDPKKVTRSAIENACSVAGTLLTTECIIVDKEK